MSYQAVQQEIRFEDAPISRIHRRVAASAFMGQICDGYTLGIVGIALSYAATPLQLTSYWMGLLGAASMLGILFGCILSGAIADRIGRLPLFQSVMIFSVGFSISQFFISDPLFLTIVRFMLGVIIGTDYTTGIALLSEWAPEKKRASILASLLCFWTLGYSIAYLIGFFMDGLGEDAWRWVLCTAAVPGIIAQLIRVGIPESPKWLITIGHSEAAAKIVHTHLGKNFHLPEKEKETVSASWFSLFSREQWKRTMVSCVFFTTQCVPFFAISIFIPLVLQKLNMSNPHASGALYNIFTIAGVLVGSWIWGMIGRRPFLLWTFYLGTIILVTLILWRDMSPVLAMVTVSLLALVLAASIVAQFSYPPELFPTELRASGVGLTIGVSRIGVSFGTFLLPVISEQFGIYTSLWACAAILLIGGVVCHIWAPETSGKGN